MKFTINKELLQNKLDIMGKVIPDKNSMPALTGMMIKVKTDRIILLGSNNEMSAKIVLQNDINKIVVEEEGNALLNFGMLKNIVSKLSNNVVEFENKSGEKTTTIKSGRGRYKLNNYTEEEYPKVEFKEYKNKIELNKNTLENMINFCGVATASNERKPILTGINFSKNENGEYITAVATDSFRLARYKTKFEKEVDKFNITIPDMSLKFISKLLDKTQNENITLLYENNSLLLELEDTLFKTVLLEGVYPPTDKLIPAYSEKSFKVEQNAIMGVVDRLSILRNDIGDKDDKFRTNIITMECTSNSEIKFESKSNSFGTGYEIIDVQEGENLEGFKIAFSAQFLISALKTFSDDIVKFNFSGEIRPFTIDNGKDLDLVQLILPVRMNN